MQLAGIQVANDDVLELARLVDEPTATLLHTALEQKTLIVALTVPTAKACSGRSPTSAADAEGQFAPNVWART